MIAAPAVDGVLATHPAVTALPFFIPTVIVIAVIAVVVWRDRHRDDDGGRDEHTPAEPAPQAVPSPDARDRPRP